MPGPCAPWTTTTEVAACCAEAKVGSNVGLLNAALDAAEDTLFDLSGRQFSGTCTKTVRPCRTRTCGCDWQVLQGSGHIIWTGTRWFCGEATPCGCAGLSRVLLPGFPVISITEVKIDGVVVAANTYRLDEDRYLTRVRDPAAPNTVLRWPACQSLDLPDTAAGTFSIKYRYGIAPPALGVEAVKQLACQIYLQCAGSSDCQLPTGVTRITRQGVTIERTFLRFDPDKRAWHTGLALVDAFLNAVNPAGLRRRPAIWSPASHLQYARPVGGG